MSGSLHTQRRPADIADAVRLDLTQRGKGIYSAVGAKGKRTLLKAADLLPELNPVVMPDPHAATENTYVLIVQGPEAKGLWWYPGEETAGPINP